MQNGARNREKGDPAALFTQYAYHGTLFRRALRPEKGPVVATLAGNRGASAAEKLMHRGQYAYHGTLLGRRDKKSIRRGAPQKRVPSQRSWPALTTPICGAYRKRVPCRCDCGNGALCPNAVTTGAFFSIRSPRCLFWRPESRNSENAPRKNQCA